MRTSRLSGFLLSSPPVSFFSFFSFSFSSDHNQQLNVHSFDSTLAPLSRSRSTLSLRTLKPVLDPTDRTLGVLLRPGSGLVSVGEDGRVPPCDVVGERIRILSGEFCAS